MKRVWVLNDLFVNPELRKQGISKKLMKEDLIYAKNTGALKVNSATQVSKTLAQNPTRQ